MSYDYTPSWFDAKFSAIARKRACGHRAKMYYVFHAYNQLPASMCCKCKTYRETRMENTEIVDKDYEDALRELDAEFPTKKGASYGR